MEEGLSRGGDGCVPGRGGGGRGEADVDVEPAVRAGVDGEGGVVGFGDGRGDGQAQAEAFVAGGAGGGEPLERLEQPGDLVGGDDRPGVGDRQLGMAGVGSDLDVDPAAGGVVADRVVDQVGGQPPQEAVVAEDGNGADRGADGQPRRSGVRVPGVQDLLSDGRQVEWFAVVEATLAAG
jgi:hypothetical protein